jgi:hypothetical protein
MADHSKWFEITVATLAVGVTLFLGISQIRLGTIQQEAASKQAADSIEIQIFELVTPHLANLSKPRSESADSRKIVEVMAEFLTDTQKRDNLAKIALKMAQGNPSVSPVDLYRLQEATASGGSGRWFAVLASLPEGNEKAAKGHANSKLQQWKKSGGGDVQIKLYRTKINRNYAVVVGGPMDQSSASSLVRQAKQLGVAEDAFVQQDKQWEEKGDAPFS